MTKVALERSRMVLCSPDWGAHGGNEYRRTFLDRLTISSVRLPHEAIYVPVGRRKVYSVFSTVFLLLLLLVVAVGCPAAGFG